MPGCPLINFDGLRPKTLSDSHYCVKHQGSAIYKDPKRVWRGITHIALENQNCQILMSTVALKKACKLVVPMQ